MDKKKIVAIISVICAVILLCVALILIRFHSETIPAWGSNLNNEEYISRSQWIEILGRNFGLTTYVENSPYYTDVQSKHTAFTYIQSCYEWEILREKETFRPDEPATRSFVAETAVLTALLDTYESFGEKSADELLQYAIQNGIVSSGNAVDPMTEEECSTTIERLKEHYFNLEVPDYANITLKESVVDYSSASGIYEDGDVVTLPSELGSAISEGTVFIIPGEHSGAAVKAVSVETVNGQTIITTVAPEEDEVFEELAFHFSGTPEFGDIVPAQEGISIFPLEGATPLSGEFEGVYLTNLSSATPLAIGNKKDPISFGINVNLTKGTLTPNVDFTDYFSVEAEQSYQELFRQSIPKNAGEILKQSSTAVYRDTNGKLSLGKKEQWKQGYEITGELKLKNLYAEVDYAKNMTSFTGKIHYEIESSLTVKGKLDGDVEIYKATIRGPWGTSLKVVFYLYLDMNGEISVGVKMDHTTSVTYKGKKFKSTEDTDLESNVSVCGGVSAGAKAEIIPMALKIQLVDVSAKAGVEFAVGTTLHKSSQDSMICMDGEIYAPKISISVGMNSKTLANKLGIKATLKLVDKSGALAKSWSKTLWHYEITAAGANNVKGCTWGKENTPGGTIPSPSHGESQDTNTTIVNPTDQTAPPADQTESPTQATDPSKEPPATQPAESKGLKYTLVGDHYEVSGYESQLVDRDIVIPSTYNGLPVTSIGTYAFSGCSSLTSISIPDSITSVSASAFFNCTNLCYNVYDNAHYLGNSDNPYLFLMSANIGIDAGASPTKSIHEKTKVIGYYAFEGSELQSITIPNGVTQIDFAAFRNCINLTIVSIPDSVISIGGCAFQSCSSLTSVIIPEGVTSIGDGAFDDCSSLTSISIPEGVTSIGDSAFDGCSSLTSISIPEGVTSIGDYALQSCSSLTSISIPDSVTSIGDCAFQGCSSLTSISIPEGVTSIGDYAFNSCSSLTSISIPDSVTSIGFESFSYCEKLAFNVYDNAYYLGNSNNPHVYLMSTDVSWPDNSVPPTRTIHENTRVIGDYAFFASEAQSIIIPGSVVYIGRHAFNSCDNLTEIIFEGTIEQWNSMPKRIAFLEYSLEVGEITCSDGGVSI